MKQEIYLLANNGDGGILVNEVFGHKNVFRLKVSVDDVAPVEVFQPLCNVQCTQDTLSAVHILLDDIGDGLREGPELDELGYKAVVVVRDERTIELDSVLRVDLLKNIGLVIEVPDGAFVVHSELKRKRKYLLIRHNVVFMSF